MLTENNAQHKIENCVLFGLTEDLNPGDSLSNSSEGLF